MPGKDSFLGDDNQSMQYTYQGITLYIPKLEIEIFLFVANSSMFHCRINRGSFNSIKEE